MCIPLPTVVSVTFYSERRIRNAQIISRSLEIVVASLSDLHACFFFFVFCFLLFFPFVHRGLIIDYRSLSKASFQLTRNAHFIFIDGCRFQSGTRYLASLLFSLDSATCNSQIIARMLSQLNPEISRNAARPAQLFMGDGGQVIRRPIAFPLHSL